MRKLVLNFLFLWVAGLVHGQFTPPVLENNAPSVDWKQINAPHFRVLFQEGGDSLAQATINTLENLYIPALSSLDAEPKKISVILQQKSSISNGFVSVGPRRAEFYIMPPQDYNFLGTNRWLDLLAVHEFRHVGQFEKSRTGLNRIVYYLFGEDAYGALAHLAMPQWFWEGDAVGAETALTHSGRGRLPEFNMGFRTNLLERGPFNYDKQYLRSFKHFVPDHYVTGYYMTTHLRRDFGSDIWDKVAERAFFAPFLPWRTPFALKKETGKKIVQNYDDMIAGIDSVWRKQAEGLNITGAEVVNLRTTSVYTHYRYPQVLGDGSVIALKSGLGDIQQFVKIDSSGAEKVMFTPGMVNDAGMLSVSGDKLAYVEYGFNPRWRAVTYSEIMIVDLESGKSKRLTRNSRYSAASLSPDQKFVATVFTSENNYSYLTVLDANTGVEVKRFPNPANEFYQMPRWSDDGRTIVAVKQRDQKKAISLFDFPSGAEQVVTSFEYENFGHPVKHGNYIYYNSPYSGIDNIYAIDLARGEHFQVTSRKYGAFNPGIHNGVLYFNDYTVHGMNLVKTPVDPSQWTPKSQVKDRNSYYYQPLVEQEDNEDILLNAEAVQYPVSDYNKAQGLVNPYSWGVYSSPTADDFLLGVVSQDVLSTAAISAGYRIEADGSAGGWFGRISYQGLFPIIDLTYEMVKGSLPLLVNGMDGEMIEIGLDEQVVTAGLSVPLVLTHSKYHENLNAGTEFSLGRFSAAAIGDHFLEATNYRKIVYHLDYSRLLKQSQRDIRSKWGQYLFTQYAHMPFGGDFSGSQLAVQGGVFMPGLFKHHSLRVGGRYQYNSDREALFSNSVASPRGYHSVFEQELWVGSLDYALPLFYPDVHIGSIINFQRLKTNLFYEEGFGKTGRNLDRYRSMGVELSTDFNIFRLLPLFDVGVRYAFIPEDRSHSIGLLIGSFSL